MTVNLNPYLNFRASAAEAMAFYQSVFGGDLTVSTFAEFGMGQEAGIGPDEAGQVMHSQLVAPGGVVLMGADVPSSMEFTPVSGNVSCSISGDDVEQLRGYWQGLSAGGTVTAPFDKAPWGDWFGMCIDRFGVSWLVNAGGTPDAG